MNGYWKRSLLLPSTLRLYCVYVFRRFLQFSLTETKTAHIQIGRSSVSISAIFIAFLSLPSSATIAEIASPGDCAFLLLAHQAGYVPRYQSPDTAFLTVPRPLFPVPTQSLLFLVLPPSQSGLSYPYPEARSVPPALPPSLPVLFPAKILSAPPLSLSPTGFLLFQAVPGCG